MSRLDGCEWLADYGTVLAHEPLSRHLTMRIGGHARWFVQVRSEDRLLALLARLKAERIPWCVLGGGSNSVAPDAGLDLVVVQPCLTRMQIDPSGLVMAEAGMITALFARQVTEAGFCGWEWGVGLPGTIGGAIAGNAGCFGGDTAQNLVDVEAWNAATGALEVYSADVCRFAYRESRFLHESMVILRAHWQLRPAANPEEARERLRAILQERQTHQPLGKASAGCVFRNTRIDGEVLKALEQQLGTRVPGAGREDGWVPSGWLLEQLGYKGASEGSMRVSDKHANFFVMQDRGTCTDLLTLRGRIVQDVYERTGIRLIGEVRILADQSSVVH